MVLHLPEKEGGQTPVNSETNAIRTQGICGQIKWNQLKDRRRSAKTKEKKVNFKVDERSLRNHEDLHGSVLNTPNKNNQVIIKDSAVNQQYKKKDIKDISATLFYFITNFSLEIHVPNLINFSLTCLKSVI